MLEIYSIRCSQPSWKVQESCKIGKVWMILPDNIRLSKDAWFKLCPKISKGLFAAVSNRKNERLPLHEALKLGYVRFISNSALKINQHGYCIITQISAQFANKTFFAVHPCIIRKYWCSMESLCKFSNRGKLGLVTFFFTGNFGYMLKKD